MSLHRSESAFEGLGYELGEDEVCARVAAGAPLREIVSESEMTTESVGLN
jgi:hypothetical protein